MAERQLDEDLKYVEMRGQIVFAIHQTYESKIADADNLKTFRDRYLARQLAEAQRDDNLELVEEFVESIVIHVKSREASPKSIEFARILQEEGVDEAITFLNDVITKCEDAKEVQKRDPVEVKDSK